MQFNCGLKVTLSEHSFTNVDWNFYYKCSLNLISTFLLQVFTKFDVYVFNTSVHKQKPLLIVKIVYSVYRLKRILTKMITVFNLMPFVIGKNLHLDINIRNKTRLWLMFHAIICRFCERLSRINNEWGRVRISWHAISRVEIWYGRIHIYLCLAVPRKNVEMHIWIKHILSAQNIRKCTYKVLSYTNNPLKGDYYSGG
jgi:hypothetical protein